MLAPAAVRPDLDAWIARAACRDEPAGLFYPDLNESPRTRAEREEHAKRMCADCPVRVECLDYALNTGQPLGVWGGMTEAQRRALPTIV